MSSRRESSNLSFGTKYQCGVKVATVVSKATPERGVGSIPTTDTKFLGSSAVEHTAVNRVVPGSNPGRGANN